MTRATVEPLVFLPTCHLCRPQRVLDAIPIQDGETWRSADQWAWLALSMHRDKHHPETTDYEQKESDRDRT